MRLRRGRLHVDCSSASGTTLSRRRVLRAWAATLGVVACMLVTVAAASAEGEVTRTFTVFEEAFVVPQGVSSIHVVAIGGAGGNGGGGTRGGLGAIVRGELEVTSRQTLYVHVGGNGISATQSWQKGTGGHASDLRSRPFGEGLSPDPRLIVAGAGGGAGGKGHLGAEIPAGEGGNAGETGGETLEASGGEPGTQIAGGEGGYGDCSSGESGRVEVGGEGGFCPTFKGLYAGDGGDGYYGGGGGGAHGKLDVNKEGEGGGGGGSSLVPAGGTVGVSSAQPKVQITYTQPANPPAVVSEEAAAVREFSATMNATVNPEDEQVTSCAFEYGSSQAYGSTVPCSTAPGSGIAPVAVAGAVSGLERATTYHYRIIATNASGTSEGADRTFSTLAQEPPTLTSVSPADGAEGGSTTVTITGTNLENASAVRFGSTLAASLEATSETSITAVSPPGNGTVDVTVTTPGGTTAASGADRFSYVAPPSATTGAAGSIGKTSATLHGSVTSSIALSDCHFDYGTSTSYGSAIPCSTLPGSGSTSVAADLSGLSPSTIYHFRLSVTNDGATTTGGDQSFTTLAPLEYGRCIKVSTGTGLYGSGSCTTLGGEKNYEWYSAFGSARPLVKTHFTLATSAKAEAKLQTTGGQLITCKGQGATGEYTGNKTVGGVTLTFTGCHLGETGTCQSAGAALGEVRSSALVGQLGVIKASAEGPAKDLVGNDYLPAAGETFAAFSCAGTPVSVTGSVIGELKRNAMVTTAPVKFVQSRGQQKPMRFEGGPEDVLLSKLGEGAAQRSGLGLTSNQTSEEKVEVNSVV